MAPGPGWTTLCWRRGEGLKAPTQQKIFQISMMNVPHHFCGVPPLFLFKFDFPALMADVTSLQTSVTGIFLLQVLGRGGAAWRLCVSQHSRQRCKELDDRKLSPAQLFHLPEADSVMRFSIDMPTFCLQASVISASVWAFQ